MNLKKKMLTGLAAIILSSSAAKAEWYNYQDHFTTNQVMTDSYSHSPIYNSPPLIQVSPYILHRSSQYDRWLQFFSGQTMAGDAELVYKLPLNGTVDGITYGAAICIYGYNPEIGPNTRSHIKISYSDDGTNWTTGFEQEPLLPFPYYDAIAQLPQMDGINIYVKIEGQNICIDELNFGLNSDTIVPTEMKSFGDVKLEYR